MNVFWQKKDMAGIVNQAHLAGLAYQQTKRSPPPNRTGKVWNRRRMPTETSTSRMSSIWMSRCKFMHMSEKKGADADAITGYGNSPEYDDLRIFLSVCRDLSITPMIVILPVNGYWYDFTEFPRKPVRITIGIIRELAAEFDGTVVADLSGEEHTKYFFEDSVHLAQKGVADQFDKALYQFAKQN